MVEEIFVWIDPEEILMKGGLFLLLFIVFAESGLYFGFFLPGDALLFAAGVYCGTDYLPLSVFELSLCLVLAAVLGYLVGFGTGKLFSKWLLRRNDGLLFKKKFVRRALNYYQEKHHVALILARFLPVFKTFIPIVSGMVNISFRRFSTFNVLGAALWVATFVLSGHFLRKAFPQILSYMEVIVIIMVIITAIPVIRALSNKSKTESLFTIDAENDDLK